MEIRVPPNNKSPKLWTWKISPRQVDRVVSKTRRRSSLSTTPSAVAELLVVYWRRFVAAWRLRALAVRTLPARLTHGHRALAILLQNTVAVLLASSGLSDKSCSFFSGCGRGEVCSSCPACLVSRVLFIPRTVRRRACTLSATKCYSVMISIHAGLLLGR